MVDIGWTPPLEGQVQFNINGAAKRSQVKVRYGGLSHGSKGEWRLGFVCNLGNRNAFVAELWSVYYALKMAQ